MQEQIPDELLKIGEFAEISGVPAKTLRYYDRIGLFKPVHVDPSTNYRYYSPDQLLRIAHILTLKDLGLSLEQIDLLLEDELPLLELRGMLRLKKIEIQEHLKQERVRLARVEARLRQIEEAWFKAKREGEATMRTCTNCGRRVQESKGKFCPYCGKPLTPSHADLLPVGKSAKRLIVRILGVLFAALTLIAVVAGLLSIVTDGRDSPELIARPSAESAHPQLTLLSLRYERLKDQGDLLFEGQVKNISDAPLTNVTVVISLYDADPELITTNRAPIANDVLPPGELSTFRLEVNSSPRAYHYGVIFQQPSGRVIPARDDYSE